MKQRWTTGLLVAGLALGWSVREAQFATAQGKRLPNTTIHAADVQPQPAMDNGKVVGHAQVLLDGATAGTKSMQVGRFALQPGESPHAPHRHMEEELLIVTRGQGKILCDGKEYDVRPGSVMYCDPNVEHGITNLGERPLVFYWVKYVPNAP